MTSKLKCPVCQHKLYQTASEPATYCCLYKDCQSDFKFAGSKELWQALIQAKQDLEKARYAITDVFGYVKEHEKDIGGCAVNIGITLGLALGQIEHKD